MATMKNSKDYQQHLKRLLQPINKRWGGMGIAQPSRLLLLPSSTFQDDFAEIFVEHVEGFGGKSFKKRDKPDNSTMEWKKRYLESKIQVQPKRQKKKGAAKPPPPSLPPPSTRPEPPKKESPIGNDLLAYAKSARKRRKSYSQKALVEKLNSSQPM